MSNYKSAQKQDRWLNNNVFKNKKRGYFVELGALDGITNSNTYFFEKEHNWDGLLIEANKLLFSEIKKTRSTTALNECIYNGKKIDFVPKKGHGSIISENLENCLLSKDSKLAIPIKSITIEQALSAAKAPKKIDYFSLDIEGAEELIIKTFPYSKYKVSCFTIERASQEIFDILDSEGYALVRRAWPDHYFLLKSVIDEINLPVIDFSEFKIKRLANGRIVQDDS